MGSFGGPIWGGGGGGTGADVGVPLASLIMPAYRIAGISKGAMIGPSPDMYLEAIPELNRMLGSWNCDGHLIYTTSISDPYPLTAGQKVYTIGPGGDFDAPRPIEVKGATALFPTTPVVRRELRILDDSEWRKVIVQDIPGAPPYALYYDSGLDDNGRGLIYLRFQPPAGYSLELYTWQALKASFTDRGDVALFPPGYERALVYNLAASLAALNPFMAKMAAPSYAIAQQSLQTLRSLNSNTPLMATEPGLAHEIGPGYGWLNGPFGQ